MGTRVQAVIEEGGGSRLCSDTEGTVGGRGRQELWRRLALNLSHGGKKGGGSVGGRGVDGFWVLHGCQ